jgi:hypothetical protein
VKLGQEITYQTPERRTAFVFVQNFWVDKRMSNNGPSSYQLKIRSVCQVKAMLFWL